MPPIQNLIVPVFAIVLLGAPLYSGEVTCEPSGLQVQSERLKDATTVCEAVQSAETVFQGCLLPDTPPGLRLDVVKELPEGCVALFHCGEKLIEVLEPGAMRERRLPGSSAFAFLGIDDYFRSVVVHELSHSVFDEMPCPFKNCVVAAEYIAYTLQVMSLTPEQQKTFEKLAELDRMISRDELSAMYLFLAPNKFAQKAWTHLNQRDDPCAFLGTGC